MIVVDTSVAVPAALPWHASHALASAAVDRAEGPILAHVAMETFSVLTRLRPPHTVSPEVARGYLRETFQFPPLVLASESYERLLDELAEANIAGGAAYDALVARTARDADAKLLTRDRRAIRTYERLGTDYELLR